MWPRRRAGGRDLPAPARLRTTARVCVGATGSRSSARHGIAGPRVSPGPAYGGRHPPLAGSLDLTPAWCDLTPAARARGRPGARGARGWRTSSTGLPCGSAPRRPLDWQSGTLTGGPPAANPPRLAVERTTGRDGDGRRAGHGDGDGDGDGRGRDSEDAHTGVGSLRDMPLPEHLAATLSAEVADAQRSWRTPGLSVGVARDGELAWSSHVGLARLDPPTPAHDDTQVMIGSITKSFTAVLVMQLRDEGRLDLEDPLGTWLPESRHASLTVRRLLSHTSGLQREPVGHLWENLDAPDVDRLRRRARGRRAGPPAASRVPLLEPRLRPARPGRRTPPRAAVGGRPAGARAHAARHEPDRPDAVGRPRLRVPGGPVRRHRHPRAQAGAAGDGTARRTLVDGRRHGALRDVPGRAGPGGSAPADSGRDVPAAGDDRHGELARRIRAGLRAGAQRRAGPRRPPRGDAGVPLGSAGQPQERRGRLRRRDDDRRGRGGSAGDPAAGSCPRRAAPDPAGLGAGTATARARRAARLVVERGRGAGPRGPRE